MTVNRRRWTIAKTIGRGRPPKDPSEKLGHRRCFRANDFEDEWLKRLADINKMSENSYLRSLIMDAYREYAKKKLDETGYF